MTSSGIYYRFTLGSGGYSDSVVAVFYKSDWHPKRVEGIGKICRVVMKQTLKSILARAGRLGLEQRHIDLAREFLDGHEFGLCLDTIVTLVCEEGIRIDEGFYREVAEAAKKLGLESGKVEKVKELM
jgi:hypothetical protein